MTFDNMQRAKIEELNEQKKKALLRGGEEKIKKQHVRGKLTAQERIDYLLDPESFVELYMFTGLKENAPGDGIICGFGTIDRRPVCVFAQDATVLGGSIGYLHGRKLYKTVERALQLKIPVIGLYDSPGARVPRLDRETDISETFCSDEKVGGSIFYINTQASGVIPQISVILGTCAGISVYSPALTDFTIMVNKLSHMFITGPNILKSVMGEEITKEELGGARVHMQLSGVSDFNVNSEQEGFETLKRLLSFLPSNCEEKPPFRETGDAPDRLNDDLIGFLPVEAAKPYDMHKVITSILDNGTFLEVKAKFAPEIIVGFGRLMGHVAGIVANQPLVLGGSLTYNSSVKQARFIRFCDAFNIPLVMLVDTPAYMPGKVQEHNGIIRHGAKVLYALCEATIPRIAVIIRKAYGGGNLGMGVRPGLGTDLIFAWPSAECGPMGAGQSVQLHYADEIATAKDPEELKDLKIKEYRELYTNVFNIASVSTRIEDIIDPRQTRRCLIKSLRFLQSKSVGKTYQKKHGNIPL